MSYAVLGGFGDTPPLILKFPMDQAQQQAKAQAKSAWSAQGYDPRIFDVADSLAAGVVSNIGAGQSPGQALLSAGVQAAQKGVMQLDPQSLADATGIPVPLVALAQQSVAEGSLPSTDQTLTAAGSVGGMAVCAATGVGAGAAPLCGAIGGLVGHLLSGPVNDIAADVTHLFGGHTSDEVERIKAETAAKNSLGELMMGVSQSEIDIINDIEYSLARFYNSALSLGVSLPLNLSPPASRYDIMEELKKGYFIEESFQKDHGGATRFQVAGSLARDFTSKIVTILNKKYPNRWVNDQVESGFVKYVRKYFFNGSLYATNNLSFFPRGTSSDPAMNSFISQFATVWPNGCTWTDLFGYGGKTSAVACEGNGLVPFLGGPMEMPCNAEQQLAAWKCHFGVHLKWFQGVAQQFGQQWADIAARNVTLELYKQNKAKAAIAAAAATKAAAARAEASREAAQAAAAGKSLPGGPSLLLLQAQVQQAAKTKKAVVIGAAGIAAAVVLWAILD